MSKDEDCFDYRFTSNGVKYGFCKNMLKAAAELGAIAITYVTEDHKHEEN